jgi:hypothetical protein
LIDLKLVEVEVEIEVEAEIGVEIETGIADESSCFLMSYA